MTRIDGRQPDELRPIQFELHYTKWAEGSVLAMCGDTHVLCNVTVEEGLPNWLRYRPVSEQHGWLTAEYALLPRSTHQRVRRETLRPKGRTQEISRLIGRSLRMAVDLNALGKHTITVDCDVLQADGGTRTTAINGAWVALKLAIDKLVATDKLPAGSLPRQIAAISAGLIGDQCLLDLNYAEDSTADADCNFVMTADGQLIELQGTAEKAPLSPAHFHQLLELSTHGIRQIVNQQQSVLTTDNQT